MIPGRSINDVDLPYDGRPIRRTFRNKQNLSIQTYCWLPASESPAGVVALLHGVRAHIRLSWLAKRPRHPEYNPAFKASDYIERLSSFLTTKESDPGSSHRDSCVPTTTGEGCDADTSTSFNLDDDELSMERMRAETPSARCVATPTILRRCSEWKPEHMTSGFINTEDVNETRDDSPRFQATPDPSWSHTVEDPEIRHPDDQDLYTFYSGSWIEALVESNLCVIGMDLQGHGLSEGWQGLRCSVREFDDYKEDLVQFLAEVVRSRYPEHPLVLVGVSMSGQVVLRFLEDPRSRQLALSGVVVLAGLCDAPETFKSHPLKYMVNLLHLLRRVAPQLPILGTSGQESGGEWQRRIGAHDPYLCRGYFTVHMVSQAFEALRKTQNDLPLVIKNEAVPSLLMVHNWTDSVNPCKSSVQTFAKLVDLRDVTKSAMQMKCVLLNCPADLRSSADGVKVQKLLGLRQRKSELLLLDTVPVQIDHTMTSDIDNGYVFKIVFDWLKANVFDSPAASIK